MKCECQNDFNISFGIKRDHAFFTKIANVRSYEGEKNNIKPRGLPVDLDNVVRNTLLESEEDTFCKSMSPFDLHSHTFFYDTEVDAFDFEDHGGLKEFKELLERVRNNFHYCSCRFLITFDN
jgi:hypothetical protein